MSENSVIYEILWINERLTQKCLVVGEKKLFLVNIDTFLWAKKTNPCRFRELFVGEKKLFLVEIETSLWVKNYSLYIESFLWVRKNYSLWMTHSQMFQKVEYG